MLTVTIIGADGQLGSDLVTAFCNHGDEVQAVAHRDLEITDPEAARRVLQESGPQVIVNTAAMHHVENCEREPEKAYAVNALGARNLALAARDLGAVLVHVSTDYVFDGSKKSPYLETDTPQPLNVYGNTKLAGEYFVRSLLSRHFVLRTSALYGKAPCRAKGGLNFVDLMLKLARERGEVRVVDDEYVSPTSTRDLAAQIVALSRVDEYGLYHATAEGSCSWYEFAREIFAIADVKVKLMVAPPGAFPAKVPRPAYSVLENRALNTRGLNRFRPWAEGLAEYLGCRQPQLGENAS